MGLDTDNIPFAQSFQYILLMGIMYLVGLVIYTYRIPERWMSEKYKNILAMVNSHVIWHFFVFGAAITHCFSVVELYKARVEVTCLNKI